MPEPARSRYARQLAETALVRLVHAYGTLPDFVLLGGLVPDLLCSRSSSAPIGTTDVDVHVNLEITSGSVNPPGSKARSTPPASKLTVNEHGSGTTEPQWDSS